LHHAMGGGGRERETPVLVSKIAGRWVRHTQDGQQYAGWPHVALSGVSKSKQMARFRVIAVN
jgi:hypothetical protein